MEMLLPVFISINMKGTISADTSCFDNGQEFFW